MDETEIGKRINAIEKIIGFQLRDDQREIVENPCYPLFRLMGYPRRYGKTVVAICWALVHENGPIVMEEENMKIRILMSGGALLQNVQAALPLIPDPDLLNHPILANEIYFTIRPIKERMEQMGIQAPEIWRYRSSVLKKQFFRPD